MTLAHAHSEPRKPTRVVVLGASGFLGRRLVEACRRADVPAVGLSSRDVDLADAAAAGALAERLHPHDVVVFVAALTPDKGRDSGTLMRNLAMARAVCEATRRVQIAQLIYASSDAVYSFATTLISEDTPAAATDLYGAMHRSRELMLASEAKAPLAILRLTAIYGAGDTHNSYGPNRFLRQALGDGRVALFGDGEMRGSTGLLNLATGQSFTFRAAADMIATSSGRTVVVTSSARQNPVSHRHFDIINLVRAFPDMRFKSLAEGLAATFADMKAEARG